MLQLHRDYILFLHSYLATSENTIFVGPFAKGHMVWGEMGIIKLYEVYEDKRRYEKPGGDRPEGPMDSRYPSWQAEPCLSETRQGQCCVLRP